MQCIASLSFDQDCGDKQSIDVEHETHVSIRAKQQQAEQVEATEGGEVLRVRSKKCDDDDLLQQDPLRMNLREENVNTVRRDVDQIAK